MAVLQKEALSLKHIFDNLDLKQKKNPLSYLFLSLHLLSS